MVRGFWILHLSRNKFQYKLLVIYKRYALSKWLFLWKYVLDIYNFDPSDVNGEVDMNKDLITNKILQFVLNIYCWFKRKQSHNYVLTSSKTLWKYLHSASLPSLKLFRKIKWEMNNEKGHALLYYEFYTSVLVMKLAS